MSHIELNRSLDKIEHTKAVVSRNKIGKTIIQKTIMVGIHWSDALDHMRMELICVLRPEKAKRKTEKQATNVLPGYPTEYG